MKYGTIPYVNKKVSKLILGTAVTPFITGGDGSETLNSALKNGINAFDMARNYGLSEYAFGNWLEKSGKSNLYKLAKIICSCDYRNFLKVVFEQC